MNGGAGDRVAGPSTQQVRVLSLVEDGKWALVKNHVGKEFQVRLDALPGLIPQPGELWLLDRQHGMWSFSARRQAVRPTISGGVSDQATQELMESLDALGIIDNQTQVEDSVAPVVPSTYDISAMPTGYLSDDGSTTVPDHMQTTVPLLITGVPPGWYDDTSNPLALTFLKSGLYGFMGRAYVNVAGSYTYPSGSTAEVDLSISDPVTGSIVTQRGNTVYANVPPIGGEVNFGGTAYCSAGTTIVMAFTPNIGSAAGIGVRMTIQPIMLA